MTSDKVRRAIFVGLLVAIAVALPQTVSAGQFFIQYTSPPILAQGGFSFDFAVHSQAQWSGPPSAEGRLFRTIWWVSSLGFCINDIPGLDCEAVGKAFAGPFPGTNNSNAVINCLSSNGCAAHKTMLKRCCDDHPQDLYGGVAEVLRLVGGATVEDAAGTYPHSAPCRLSTDGCECGCSPIVLDLAGDGFRFTSAAEGVRFDFAGSGREGERVGWTRANGDDAFLALDRNGDGRINDGSELFGNFTPQPKSDEPHGYRALAQYDDPAFGGNGDKVITSDDQAWEELLVWRDANHDGDSQSWELSSVEEAGVESIDLDYWRSTERDVHGNALRYFSCAWMEGGLYSTPIRHYGQSILENDAEVLDPMNLRDRGVDLVSSDKLRLIQTTDVFFVGETAAKTRTESLRLPVTGEATECVPGDDRR